MVLLDRKPTLRSVRLAHGLTQQDVAERAHVTVGTVYRIEAGHSRGTPAYRWWLASVFGLTPESINWPDYPIG